MRQCLDERDMSVLMTGELAEYVITDPPYNVKIINNVSRQKKKGAKGKSHGEFVMASGEMSNDEFVDFLNSGIIKERKTSVSICLGTSRVFESYDNKKHHLNSIRFQIFPRSYFDKIIEYKWVNREILHAERFFDDLLMLLLTVVAGADLQEIGRAHV